MWEKIKSWFGPVSKAIAGFIFGVASVIIARFMSGEEPIPSISPFDKEGWLSVLIAGVLSYLGVYAAPKNVPKPAETPEQIEEAEKQIEKDAGRLPIDARQRVANRLNPGAEGQVPHE